MNSKERVQAAIAGEPVDMVPLGFYAVDCDTVEYIEVTLDDIETANRLANEVLGQSLDELAKPSRTLLSAIYKMVKQIDKPIDEVHFNRRMIREQIAWTDWQVRTHIKQLEDLEYLYARIGARGKEYTYALNYRGQGEDSGKCYLNLTPVEEIKKLIGLRQATPHK